MTDSRPDWDVYFLGVATAVAARGDCRRRKVGAVLVDSGHRVIGTGYNGAPPGGPSCLAGECPRGLLGDGAPANHTPGAYDSCVAVHAEVNALLFATRSARGATAYVTRYPCTDCSRAMDAAGVDRVVHAGELSTEHRVAWPARWFENGSYNLSDFVPPEVSLARGGAAPPPPRFSLWAPGPVPLSGSGRVAHLVRASTDYRSACSYRAQVALGDVRRLADGQPRIPWCHRCATLLKGSS